MSPQTVQNQMFQYRMSSSAALFTIRSSSVCQNAASTNSTVICMFPWYILDWLSNLKLLTRTGKSCNGNWRMKNISFIVKTWCATKTICINCQACSVAHSLSNSHALVVPLGGPGGAAPVLLGSTVHQSTPGYKSGLLPTLIFITHEPHHTHW